MRVITIVSLGASAVLGLGALVVAKTVLPHAAAAKQAATVTAGVPVVVAANDIKYGTKLDARMLTIVRAPAEAVPQGAFSTIQQVLATDHGGPPVALTPIAAREPLLPAKLSGPGARPTMAAEITEGMRAYTLKTTDVSGVGGHALPGDRVDVVLMRDLTPSGPTRTYVANVVLQNARVLGVDLNADLNSEKPSEPKNVTLEVSVEDAQKLAIAATLGSLSLALRRTGAAELEPPHVVSVRDFINPPAAAARGARGARGATIYSSPLLIDIVEYSGRGSSRPAATPAQPPVRVATIQSDNEPGGKPGEKPAS